MVTVVFDDSVPMYFARQLVSERLQQISSLLPQGVQPSLGLPATAFGELYQYTLSGPMSAMELKDLHEWVIKGQLRTIPGVSEINAWGGQTKQFQIVVDPALLRSIRADACTMWPDAVEENNTNFGGGYIEHASEQYTLLGSGPRYQHRRPRQYRADRQERHAGAGSRRGRSAHRIGAAAKALRCATAKPSPAW